MGRFFPFECITVCVLVFRLAPGVYIHCTCTRICCVVSSNLLFEQAGPRAISTLSYRSVRTNLHLSVPKQLKIYLDREDFKTSFEGFQQ